MAYLDVDKQKEYNRSWYSKNKESQQTKKRAYYHEKVRGKKKNICKDPEKRNEYYKQWYERNKEQERAKQKAHYQKTKKGNREFLDKKLAYYNTRGKWLQLQRIYGLSKEQYESMVANQPLCPVCNEPFTNEAPSVIDHNHATGKVRALLHDNCNFMVGYIENHGKNLSNVLEYLKKYE